MEDRRACISEFVMMLNSEFCILNSQYLECCFSHELVDIDTTFLKDPDSETGVTCKTRVNNMISRKSFVTQQDQNS